MDDGRGETATRRGRPAGGDAERTRERIVDAALAVVAERGVEGVTLREVARRAGLTAPAIYTHFPDLPALLMSAMRREVLRRWPALDDDPAERLRAWMLDEDDTGRRLLLHVYDTSARVPAMADLLGDLQASAGPQYRSALGLDEARNTALSMLLLGASFIDALDGLEADRAEVAEVMAGLVRRLIDDA